VINPGQAGLSHARQADKARVTVGKISIRSLSTSTISSIDTMTKTFVHNFDTPVFKGKVEVPLGLFIDGKFVDGSEGKTIECVHPLIAQVSH
jgi:hypothetical protein